MRACRSMSGASRGNPEPAFEQAECGVCGECEQGGGDCAGEDEAVVDRRDAAEDELAEAACAVGGGDGGNADAGDGGGAQAGEDEGRGERKFYFEEALRVGEAERAGN